MTIATSVAVFFAMNPDEELISSDIEAKFGVEFNHMRQAMRNAVRDGWVTSTKKEDPTTMLGWRWHYTAGPKILNQLIRDEPKFVAPIAIPASPCSNPTPDPTSQR